MIGQQEYAEDEGDEGCELPDIRSLGEEQPCKKKCDEWGDGSERLRLCDGNAMDCFYPENLRQSKNKNSIDRKKPKR